MDGGRHGSAAAGTDAKTRSPGMKTKELIREQRAESGAPAERSPPQRDAAGADIRWLKEKNK